MKNESRFPLTAFMLEKRKIAVPALTTIGTALIFWAGKICFGGQVIDFLNNHPDEEEPKEES